MSDPGSGTDASPARADRARSAPRLFWVGLAVFLTLMVFAGFGSTYGRQLVLGLEISGAGVVEADWVIHLHAAVFVGWMGFLLTQTGFMARGRARTHMSLGWYGGIALGTAVVLVGSVITYVQATTFISEGLITWSEVPLRTMQSWASLLGFALLLTLGLLYRRRPEVHKRHMVFATMTLVLAATSRMGYLFGEWENTIGVALMVAPVIGYDLYNERRVRPASLLGTGVMGALLVVEYLFG